MYQQVLIALYTNHILKHDSDLRGSFCSTLVIQWMIFTICQLNKQSVFTSRVFHPELILWCIATMHGWKKLKTIVRRSKKFLGWTHGINCVLRDWFVRSIWKRLLIGWTGNSLIGFASKRFWGEMDYVNVGTCVVNLWFSVLLNGTSKGFLGASRGLRQRYPVSPFFFSLVADFLSALINHVVCSNLVKGYKMHLSDIVTSHLQFVDNTILFIKPKIKHIFNLKHILQSSLFQV